MHPDNRGGAAAPTPLNPPLSTTAEVGAYPHVYISMCTVIVELVFDTSNAVASGGS